MRELLDALARWKASGEDAAGRVHEAA